MQDTHPQNPIEKAITKLVLLKGREETPIHVEELAILFGYSSDYNGAFRAAIKSMEKYGMTKSDWKTREVAVTELGKRIINDDLDAVREAILTPPLHKVLWAKQPKDRRLTRKEINHILLNQNSSAFTKHTATIATNSFFNSIKYLDMLQFYKSIYFAMK